MYRISNSNRSYWLLSAAVVKQCLFKDSASVRNFQRSASIEFDRVFANNRQKNERWTPGPCTSSNAIPIKERVDQPVVSDGGASNTVPDEEEKEGDEEDLTEYQKRVRNVARCLKYYLKKRAAHEKMMDEERAKFELGKRHLANIMGWDPQLHVSQEQVDRAIEYLFPSSLHDQKALPVMKPPDEILPKFNRLDFDAEGRPLDAFFYTTRPKFSRLLSEINDRTQSLIQLHDQQVLRGVDPDTIGSNKKVKLPGTQWIPLQKLKRRIGREGITDEMYASFVLAMDFLAEQKLASTMSDFINDWRESLSGASAGGGKKIFGCQLPLVKRDQITNRKCTVVNTHVKSCNVTVKVVKDGTGKFTVNGQHYGDFRTLQEREILLCPLIVTDLLGKLDVECKTEKGENGESVLPRAIRHGTSLGIAAMFKEKKEILRISGLLTLDVRRTERSKINQPGARKKWLWKKR